MKVKVLRDTGCTDAVVKTGLVREDQRTGRHMYCALVNGSIKRFPLANIQDIWITIPELKHLRQSTTPDF